MLSIIFLAEGVGCSVALSTVAWLRYLSGVRLSQRLEMARFVLPIVTAVGLVLQILLAIDEQRRGEFHPESSPRVAGVDLFLGVVLAGMVGWVVVEVRRYRARPHGVPRGNRFEDEDEDGDMAHAREGQHKAR